MSKISEEKIYTASEVAELIKVVTSEFSLKLSAMAEKVNELHAITTGKLYNSKGTTKLTKKQKENAELDELRRQAHIRVLNRVAK